MRIKYPRTRHLPWSPGGTSDDIHLNTLSHFVGKIVVVTEKMDGENTTIYHDYIHARSLDSRHHESRAWVKALQARLGHQIPVGWRVCGENLFAQHSVVYQRLDSYFLAFSIWNEHNQCLSWNDTLEWLDLLELKHPKVLYHGVWDEKLIQTIRIDEATEEGYVVRLADAFEYKDFKQSVAKWVRKNHVQSDKHWMHQAVIANGLKPKANVKGDNHED
jgi:hypothetical protein